MRRDKPAHRPLLLGVPTVTGRVERWRGGLGAAYLFPALSSAGASVSAPCSVSPPAHQTGRTAFSHPAFGQRITCSLTESSVLGL